MFSCCTAHGDSTTLQEFCSPVKAQYYNNNENQQYNVPYEHSDVYYTITKYSLTKTNSPSRSTRDYSFKLHSSVLIRKHSINDDTMITSSISNDTLTKKVNKIARDLKILSRTRSCKASINQMSSILIRSPKSNFKFFTTYLKCPKGQRSFFKKDI